MKNKVGGGASVLANITNILDKSLEGERFKNFSTIGGVSKFNWLGLRLILL